MAIRRMFSLQVVDTDKFIEMSISARLLYYELGMRADDDGFVASPKKIIRSVGCSEDDMRLLISKGFIIPKESGIVIIRHWKLNNYIQSDRYKATIYQDEMKSLTIERGIYNTDTPCIQDVSVGKDRIGKDNIYSRDDSTAYTFDVAEIIGYLNQKAGTHYRANTANTVKHLTARMKEGYTIEQIKAVIDSKVKEWQGTDMSKYLRPDTLFGSKFESYHNAVTARQVADGTASMYANYAPPYRGEEVTYDDE